MEYNSEDQLGIIWAPVIKIDKLIQLDEQIFQSNIGLYEICLSANYLLEVMRTIRSHQKDRLHRSLQDGCCPQMLVFPYHDIRARDNFRHPRQPYQKS